MGLAPGISAARQQHKAGFTTSSSKPIPLYTSQYIASSRKPRRVSAMGWSKKKKKGEKKRPKKKRTRGAECTRRGDFCRVLLVNPARSCFCCLQKGSIETRVVNFLVSITGLLQDYRSVVFSFQICKQVMQDTHVFGLRTREWWASERRAILGWSHNPTNRFVLITKKKNGKKIRQIVQEIC
jgi:hypothetical protein